MLSSAAALQPLSNRQRPGLYIISTPLGNLKDLSFRALETLKEVELILCEDTRVSRKLLTHYGVTTRLRAVHDYNESKMIPFILSQLEQQKSLALISDAGTPLISDPGYKIIQAVIAHNFSVTALPGPCAVINALVLSGLPSHRFFFNGFLPAKTGERQKELQELAFIPSTLIFYEAPQRLVETLKDMQTLFKRREVVIVREMTKKFEEVIRGTWEMILEYLSTNPARGEIVLLIGPPAAEENQWDEEKLTEELSQSLSHQSLKAAVQEISTISGLSKKIVYQKALSLLKNI